MKSTHTILQLEEAAKALPLLPNVEGIALLGYEKPYHQPLGAPEIVTSRNSERAKHLLRVLPDTIQIDTLLDLGAGNSQITDYLTKTYIVNTAYACDVYPEQEFIPPTIDSKIIYREVKNDIIPVDNNSIDLVTAFMSIHHFSNPDKIIQEIRRILRPGKWLFFREHDVTSIRQTHQLNRLHNKYGANKGHHMLGKTRYWGRKELQKFLEHNGFRHVASSEYEKENNPQAIYHSLFKLEPESGPESGPEF